MTPTELRELSQPHRSTAVDVARPEPSHIHIPRPSRLRQAAEAHRDAHDQLPVQLELVEDAA